MDGFVPNRSDIHAHIPLHDSPRRFAEMQRSPYRVQYLSTLLQHAPRGATALEIEIGEGYDSMFLSLRGVKALGMGSDPVLVERARQANQIVGALARFQVGDPFELFQPGFERYHLIHHNGIVQRLPVHRLKAALAQQVCMARRVILSVPSCFYPYDPQFADELLWPIQELEHHLAPFDIEFCRYYGDPQHGEREHILCCLKGQDVNDELLALMQEAEPDLEPGITAIVLARNEEVKLPRCLAALKFTQQTIVADMGSTDATADVAEAAGASVIRLEHVDVFDHIRNVVAQRVATRYCLVVDADEVIPPGLAEDLVRISLDDTSDFSGMLLPFKHYLGSHWLRLLGAGYTAPRLLRTGKFHFGKRLHGGVQLDGPTARYPAQMDNAIQHYSNDSFRHYREKQITYTQNEALTMFREGREFDVREMLLHAINDFLSYYANATPEDGPWGLIYALESADYRIMQHAALLELRANAGVLKPHEFRFPGHTDDIVRFLLDVIYRNPAVQPDTVQISDSPDAVNCVYGGPFFSPSGIGEEARSNFKAMLAAGIEVRPFVHHWPDSPIELSEADRADFEKRHRLAARPGFTHFYQDLGRWQKLQSAGHGVVRHMFETDRLPSGVAQQLNKADCVVVPSEFNRKTFIDNGVDPGKLEVIPGCLDVEPYDVEYSETQLTESIRSSGRFTFLSVHEWSLRKGYDVLLRAFFIAFKDRTDVQLVLKVWPASVPCTPESIRKTIADLVMREFGIDIEIDGRLIVITDSLSREELISLYRVSHAYVCASRGEGWGRTYMEAMALGVPTIGVRGTGNMAFMNDENSFLVVSRWVPVPPEIYAEIPTYRGHRCAEPDLEDLVVKLKQVVDEPAEAAKRALKGKQDVREQFSPAVVGKIYADLFEKLTTKKAEAHALPASLPARPPVAQKRKLRVRMVGEFFVWHSLALCNREMARRLATDPDIELSIVRLESQQFGPEFDPGLQVILDRTLSPLSGPADIEIRHHYPPRFTRPNDPETKLIVVAPWEYYALPTDWVEPVKQNVDEVWCYSSSVKECYQSSGVPEPRLQTIPLGVDTAIFRPDAPPYIFTNEPGAHRILNAETPPFVILFCGGTIERKGIDTLIGSYLNSFSVYDNIVLVIKDTCVNTAYRGGTQGDRLRAIAADPSRPALIYIDLDLSPAELAGLYTIANLVALPYHNEGFCLPALEAKASGVPPAVPKGGPTDDFCNDKDSYILPATRESTGSRRVGDWDCCGETERLVVNPRDLGRTLRHAYEHREEAAALGKAGLERVRAEFTWDHTVAKMKARMLAAHEKPQLPAPSPPSAQPVIVTTGPEPGDEARRSKIKDRRAAAGGKSASGPVASFAILREPPKIALCMIARQEERVIRACLESAVPHVDRVYIVDTGSTDRTVDICESFAPKVVVQRKDWTNSFSAARNWSLDMAQDEQWRFWMDCDDTLPSECGEGIRRLLADAEDRVAGFLMQVHIPPAPGADGFTMVDHLKLFRNDPRYRFEGRIHEQILASIHDTGGTVQHTNLYVIHSGYDYSTEGQARKRQRDELLLRLDEAERPTHPFPKFNWGMSLFYWGDYPTAVVKLQECLALSGPRDSTVRKVYSLLGASYLGLGNRDDARKTFDKGLSLFPRDSELLFRTANLYKDLGDLPASEERYLRLLNGRESGHFDSLDITMTTYKLRHNLALTYRDMGKIADAETHWRAALSHKPDFLPALCGIGELFARTRRFDDALTIAERLSAIDPAAAADLTRLIAGGRTGASGI